MAVDIVAADTSYHLVADILLVEEDSSPVEADIAEGILEEDSLGVDIAAGCTQLDVGLLVAGSCCHLTFRDLGCLGLGRPEEDVGACHRSLCSSVVDLEVVPVIRSVSTEYGGACQSHVICRSTREAQSVSHSPRRVYK